MKLTPLSDPSAFRTISGLWKGKAGPLIEGHVIRSTNFRKDGLLDYSDVAVLQVEERAAVTRELEMQDIIIERSGGGPKQPVGRIGLFAPSDPTKHYFTSNFTSVLRVADRERFDPLFVSLFMQALYSGGATETLQRATNGIRNLDWTEYLSLAIPEIDIEAQRFVASAIAQTRQSYLFEEELIAMTQKLKRATMRELFTRGLRGGAQMDSEIGRVPESWKLDRIDALGRVVTGNTPPTKDRSNYDDGDIPFIAPGDIEHGRRIESAEKCLSQQGLRSSRPLPRGSTCFVCIGSTIGKVGMTTAEISCTNQQVNSVIPYDDFDPGFVFHLLTYWSDHIKKERSPSPVPIMSKGVFEKVEVWTTTDKEEQREISAILDAIDAKIDLHKRKKLVLEELFRALLHKLMTGEIRVADLDLSALEANQKVAA